MPDFLSCLPFQYIDTGGKGGKATKALRLVRMTKMLRLAKIKNLIGSRIGGRYGLVSELFTFGILFGLIVYIAHLLGCFWYLVGRYSYRALRRALV